MKIHLHTQDVHSLAADVLIVPVFENETAADDGLNPFDDATGGLVAEVVGTDEMKGKAGETVFLHATGKLAAKRLLLIGLGEAGKLTAPALRKHVAVAARIAAKKGATSLGLHLRGALPARDAAAAVVEGMTTGLYDTAIYRTNPDKPKPVEAFTLHVAADRAEDAQHGIELGHILGNAVNFARSLSVEPGNKLTPREMARRAEEMAKANGLQFETFDNEKMKELGMGSFLGVAQGSDEPAQLITLRYRPANPVPGKRIALVGKGITFDSGGICIKPRDNMWEMKYDMSGGAAVIGAMLAIAQLKPDIEVDGFVGATENLPSGKSYKPGDVLHSFLGKTIEVIDTDAEGRLVLADVVAYACSQGATHVIDLATLTGAVVVSLGTERAGLMTSNRDFANEVFCAAAAAGEKFWELPLDEEYRDLIKSDIADIKNLGGRFAGTITAGYFVREFVGDTPWVHLDIAGTAWLDDGTADMAKGPTGFGVRTLAHLVRHMAAENV